MKTFIDIVLASLMVLLGCVLVYRAVEHGFTSNMIVEPEVLFAAGLVIVCNTIVSLTEKAARR